MRELEFDALTAGVKLGGLNSQHTIRVLLCYLIEKVGEPITQHQLEMAAVHTELVNYFEFGDALSRLEKQNLVTLKDGAYTITKDGREVAQSLASDVPYTVKEQALNVAVKCLDISKIAKHTTVNIQKVSDEQGYKVTCTIKDDFGDMFSTSILMPDEQLAKHVEKRLFYNGTAVYSCMLAALTGDPSMFSAAMKSFKES